MLDVYFAVRYLQLRDDISDEGDDRSTRATLDRLAAASSLETADYEALSNGYELLRAVDHHLRLIVGKVSSLPSIDHSESEEIAAKLGFRNAAALHEALIGRMQAIRASYDRIMD
jgi:glutamine synthetase adenylyltransferase